MDTKRIILYGALGIIIYNLITAWGHDYPSAPTSKTSVSTSSEPANHLLPELKGQAKTANTPVIDKPSEQGKTISVKTDVLDVTIDLNQGDVTEAKLLEYPISVQEKNKPFVLLQDSPDKHYVANSNIIVSGPKGTQPLNIEYESQQSSYVLNGNSDVLKVVLTGKTAEGLKVEKVYTFKRGDYLVNMAYQISNNSDTPWSGYLNTQITQQEPQKENTSYFQMSAYTGGSYSNPGHHLYEKISFKEMSKKNLDVDVNGGWIAMQQHYFLTAWIPPQESESKLYTRSKNNVYVIGAVSQALNVGANQSIDASSKLYLGPESTDVLKDIAPGLDMTIDYGWLWFLSSFIFQIMKFIHKFVGNWGWSIVLVTVLIKLAFYRLSATSYKSMAGMRRVQPKLQELKERYGDDRAKMSQATMELYKKEKINPLGGCLPIIVQIPVFIALYWVLLESVELRQAPFIFWIQDLSTADPYHVLPLIMGATMLVQQRLNPAPPDPVQAKMMMLLPLVFTALFWSFPSGLVLYWIVNNTLSIMQQWYITRKYGDKKPSSKTVLV